MTTILIVDDHPIVRQGLRSLLSNYPEFEVVGEAASAGEGLALYRRLRPDVALIDIRLGAGSGLDLLDAVLEADPAARTLVVSSFDDGEYVTRSLRAEMKGWQCTPPTSVGLRPQAVRREPGQSGAGARACVRLRRLTRPCPPPPRT